MSMELPIINNNPKNVCLTRCEAACCRNMFVQISSKQLPLLTPTHAYSRECLDEDELSTVADSGAAAFPGVYYIQRGTNEYMVYIAGKCPNLREDFKCGIYEDRPDACQILQAGDKECSKMRRRYGLRPVLAPEPSPSALSRFKDLISRFNPF